MKDVRTAEGMETRPEHAPPVVDNYDQVEMDIDSGCSSPACEYLHGSRIGDNHRVILANVTLSSMLT